MGVFPFPMPFSGPPKFGTMFTPLSLFAANEPGGFYDFSDLSVMFQDAAGTTPVTAVEQPVGLVLDKSRPITYGSELVSNGTFATNTTGWATSASPPATMSASVVSGAARLVYGASSGLAGQFSQGISVTAGKSYRITATVTPVTGTVNANISIRDTASSATSANLGFQPISGSGTTSIAFYFHATSTTTVYLSAYFFTTSCTIDLDDVSMREMSGSHLSQSTAAARPVLSARVNLLTYTEQFDNAAWTKAHSGSSFPVVTANQAVAPDGTTTADEIVFGAITTAGGYSVIYQDPTGTSAVRLASVWAKAKSAGDVGKKIHIYTNASTDVSSYTLTADWQRITSPAAASTNPSFTIGALGSSFSGGGNQSAFSAYIWGADLRPANSGVGLPSYQRVGAATSGSSTAAGNADYDTTGFPLYLKFDGTDDSLSSGSIDFTSTDKMSVFAGVRKLSDAATFGPIVELSTNPANTNGTFAMHAPRFASVAASLVFENRGSTGTRGTPVYDSAATPSTFIATGIGDIANDITRLRHNGVLRATATDDLGTGNYSNNPIYVGNRPGFTAFFNGHLYSLIVRGAATDAATITATETWVNGKTKAF